MPGTSVIQTGQLGAQASLFIRGGDSDANKVLLDGVSAGDLGGRFDFGPLVNDSHRAARRSTVARIRASTVPMLKAALLASLPPTAPPAFPPSCFMGTQAISSPPMRILK